MHRAPLIHDHCYLHHLITHQPQTTITIASPANHPQNLLQSPSLLPCFAHNQTLRPPPRCRVTISLHHPTTFTISKSPATARISAPLSPFHPSHPPLFSPPPPLTPPQPFFPTPPQSPSLTSPCHRSLESSSFTFSFTTLSTPSKRNPLFISPIHQRNRFAHSTSVSPLSLHHSLTFPTVILPILLLPMSTHLHPHCLPFFLRTNIIVSPPPNTLHVIAANTTSVLSTTTATSSSFPVIPSIPRHQPPFPFSLATAHYHTPTRSSLFSHASVHSVFGEKSI